MDFVYGLKTMEKLFKRLKIERFLLSKQKRAPASGR